MSTNGFSRQALRLLRCPCNRGALEVTADHAGDEHVLMDADLRCEFCDLAFSIRGGILDLLNQQGRLADIQRAEIGARNAGAEIYDQAMAERYDREMPSTLAALPPLESTRLIEYGCGTGRLTGSLMRADLIIACDFSRASLEILARKHAGAANLGPVLADASALHTLPGAFDCAVATQVLEHLPKDARRRFYVNVRETLRAGGVFLSTSYYYDLRNRLHRLPREGYHRNGIFYRRFTAAELKQEMRDLFEVERIRMIDITLPGEGRLGLLPRLGGPVSRMVERVPILRQFANLVLVRARKAGPAARTAGVPASQTAAAGA